MKAINVGIIGANWTGSFHTPGWRALPGVDVKAICTSREETARAAAERLEIGKFYWDYREMARDPELDIIVVGTDPSQRYDMVMSALEAGKHVYNCIPFAMDSEHARAQRDAARSRGLIGVVDAQWRWTPPMRRMKELCDEGALGRLFTANITLYLPMWQHDGFTYTNCILPGTARPYMWLSNASSGASAWRNFGTHCILNLMYLFGEIEEVIGVTETFLKEMKLPDGAIVRPQTADFGSALARFKNGGLANINVSWSTADGPGFRLEVCGSKGRMLAQGPGFFEEPTSLYYGDCSKPGKNGYSPGGLVELPDRLYEVEGTDLTKGNAHRLRTALIPLFADMVKVVRNGSGDGSPSFAEAAHAHCTMEAVERSMETRSWVRVSDV